MTNNELKKLRRRDLLELLMQQTQDNERLQAQNATLTAQLQNKQLTINNAGTLAEAVVQLNDLFRTADAVAKQYLDNIRRLSAQQEEICAQIEQESRERCEAMLAEAEQEREAKKQEAETFWQELSVRLEHFYEEHKGLRELLSDKGIAT